MGNVVQSIPFIDANRDGHVLLSLRKLLVPLIRASQSLPSLSEILLAFCTCLINEENFAENKKTETHKKTQEKHTAQTAHEVAVHLKKNGYSITFPDETA